MESTSQWYASESAAVEQQRNALRAGDRGMNVARAGLFFLGVLLLALGWSGGESAPSGARLLWWGGWLVLLGFFAVVTIHEGRRERIEMLRNRRNVLRRLQARRERNWSRLPVWRPAWTRGGAATENEIALADDLDLFGEGSLMQLVSMAYTGPGLRTLSRWLTDPAIESAGTARSAAAKALVADRESRLKFYERARQASTSAAEPDAFCDWASGPGWLSDRRWLLVWAWISPFAILALFLLGGLTSTAFSGADSIDGGGEVGSTFDVGRGLLWAGLPILINLILTVWSSGPIHGIFARAVNRRGDIDSYAEMFACGQALPAEPAMIGEVKARLGDPQSGATSGMRQLAKLAHWVVMRRGGVGYLFFTALQLVLMWDVYLLARLERWQAAHGARTVDWFAALGELEALQSLAALYDDYPDWIVPAWTAAGKSAAVKCEDLAHPLLKDGQRVANSVTIGPTGSLLLVTGSNMSGKSTLLRSIGLNVVLAGAGGPVCARQFSLPPVELSTSIRVRDSVKEGVSFYMAELHRLRDVVTQAREVSARADRMCLYLLDEILQGTNSRERAIAVVQVLRHLMDSDAIGAISTHDLELASDPDLEPRAHVVHFRETIEVTADGTESMTFDYKMREGVTPTTNALRLLELVGL